MNTRNRTAPPKFEGTTLLFAVMRNQPQKVKEFLVSNPPPVTCQKALTVAARLGHTECVDLLYAAADPQKTLSLCRTRHADEKSNWRYLEQKVEADDQRKILHQHVSHHSSASPKSTPKI